MSNFIRYVSLYIKEPGVRFNVAILLGLILNGCYIVFNLVLGIVYGNIWYITVAAYYMLIAVLRYLLIDGGEGGCSDEGAKTVSSLMLVVALPMTGMIIYTVITNNRSALPSVTLPFFFAYAIISIFRAVKGLFASKKETGESRRVAHAIRLSLALLSLFNLQTSLFSYFDISGNISTAINFITGGAASISVLLLADRNKG